ncbi:MAG: SiaB family protein kinase [Bacteroides sp.]
MSESSISSYLQYVEEEYHALGGGEVMLAYEGEVSQSLILALTGLIELEIVKSGEDAKVQKQLFHILVEGLQNIMKHADPLHGERCSMYSGRGVVMLIRTQDCYYLLVGNAVLSNRVPEMESRLERLKNANDEELKAMHRASLRGNEISDKGGAGLGFIDMARKAQEIDYRFLPLGGDRHFYMLKVKLLRKS